MAISMVDLKRQYTRLKEDIDESIQRVLSSAAYVKGPETEAFEEALSHYLENTNTVTCGNGTDALQIALMSLHLSPGDEIIVPSFTFIASAEVIQLLQFTPIFVDVDPQTFNITTSAIKAAITPKTKVIIPVHLYGQCAPMEEIMKLAKQHNLYVIEDACQALGSDYYFSDGTVKKAGTIGHIGCTSFFPSKPLGCFGDGGAIFTSDPKRAKTIRAIANHGMQIRYHHDVVGVNSRLDAIQAAILNVKLKHLDSFNAQRAAVAKQYDKAFSNIPEITIPRRNSYCSHVFHQYTMLINAKKREKLISFLKEKGIPSMVYYPIPLHKQKVFSGVQNNINLKVSEALSESVLSLPIHTEMFQEEILHIIKAIKQFYKK